LIKQSLPEYNTNLQTCAIEIGFGGAVSLMAVMMASFTCIAAPAETQCATCHPREAKRFFASPMGQSIGRTDDVGGGHVEQQSSGSEVWIEVRHGQMTHRLSERGLTAEYPVAYQVGYGVRGKSYLVNVGDYLLESPVSWYRDHGWDISPGYEGLRLIDFDRPVTETCLFCHANAARFTDADQRRVAPGSLTAITCERCHGNGEEHVRHPIERNIVNLANLPTAERDSICEQCHLEGDTRVVNPKRSPESFRAGSKLEDTLVTYLYESRGGAAVSQVEELAQSRCARVSGGKLWCGSCHDPHGERVNRALQVKAVCTSCHQKLSSAAHSPQIKECVTCHMPTRPTSNIAHVSVTDHRIRRPGEAEPAEGHAENSVYAWREPLIEFRQRDLAIADLRIGSERRRQATIEEGVRLLQALPANQQNDDAAALSALQSIYLMTSAPAKALALSEWAEAAEPSSATFAMNLGIALKRAGDGQRAATQLLKAIELDPSLMQAYAELAVLYDEEHRPEDAREIISRFLAWNPQSIQFRLARTP
jgi:predicted CXXCH cytochrome family protein